MSKEYTPHVYKLIIVPYYANYMLSSKLPNDDNDDWKMLANGASSMQAVREIVHREVDRIFDEYDYAPPKKEDK